MSLLSILAILAAVTPPIPPVVTTSGEVSIVEFRPGPVACGGVVLQPQFVAAPMPISMVARDGRMSSGITTTFKILPDGRPISIAQPRTENGGYPFFQIDDLAAALAAWRFPSGPARDDCRVTFTPHAEPVATAPLATIYRLVALPRLSETGWDVARIRAYGTAGNCAMPRPPTRLLIGLPDFDRIAQPPATLSWTMVGFDIDRRGRPERVHTLASDGNAALDRASIAAIRRSRYAAGDARTGCSYSFYRRQNVALAPPPPPAAKGSEAACADKVSIPSTSAMPFPPAFRRRSIEGWAIVQYDVAPWGATANVKVLRAEPAWQFGDYAQRLVVLAKGPSSPTGASGCIMRVRYKLPSDSDEPVVD